MKTVRTMLLILSFSLLLTACWSGSPIEDVNMEVGVALDVADETSTEEGYARQGGEYPKQNKVSCTYQFVIPQGAVGSKKEGSQSNNFYNATQTGDSIFEAVRELSLRSNRLPIGHHLKVIVIGEKLARSTKLSELIEFFSRDNDIRPSVLLMTSKGRARDLFEHALPGQTPAFVLNGTFSNRKRTMRMWEPVSMAKVVGPLHGHTSFLMQNVITSGKETKFSGAGVIKGDTGLLSGFLSEEELEGVVWITGKGKGGSVKTYNPENRKLITYEIQSVASQIKVLMKGDEVSFHVSVASNGRISEAYVPGGGKLAGQTLQIEKEALQKRVAAILQGTVYKMQHELKADVAGFGKALQIQYPSRWRQMKDGWDETFSKLPVTYEVKMNIEDFGASSTTSE